jgi:hypothetical protein
MGGGVNGDIQSMVNANGLIGTSMTRWDLLGASEAGGLPQAGGTAVTLLQRFKAASRWSERKAFWTIRTHGIT